MLVLKPRLDEEIIFRCPGIEIKLGFFIKKQQVRITITMPDSVDVTREKIAGSVDKKIISGRHIREGK